MQPEPLTHDGRPLIAVSWCFRELPGRTSEVPEGRTRRDARPVASVTKLHSIAASDSRVDGVSFH